MNNIGACNECKNTNLPKTRQFATVQPICDHKKLREVGIYLTLIKNMTVNEGTRIYFFNVNYV